MCFRRDVEPLDVVGVPGDELQPDELGGGDGLVRQSPGQSHHRPALQELQHQAHLKRLAGARRGRSAVN